MLYRHLRRIAIERGPLVYCAEHPDNIGFNVRNIIINQKPKFTIGEKLILDKYAVKTLTTDAQVLSYAVNGELQTTSVKLNLIPYYAWNHRGRGSMLVWIPQEIGACNVY